MLVRGVNNGGWIPLLWKLLLGLKLWEIRNVLASREMALSQEDMRELICTGETFIKGLVQLKNFNWRTQLRDSSTTIRAKLSKNRKDLLLALFAYELNLIESDNIAMLSDIMCKGNFFPLMDLTLQYVSSVFIEDIIALVEQNQPPEQLTQAEEVEVNDELPNLSGDTSLSHMMDPVLEAAHPTELSCVASVTDDSIAQDHFQYVLDTMANLSRKRTAEEHMASPDKSLPVEDTLSPFHHSSLSPLGIMKFKQDDLVVPANVFQEETQPPIIGEPVVDDSFVAKATTILQKLSEGSSSANEKPLQKSEYKVPLSMQRPASAFCFYPNPIGFFIMLGLYHVTFESMPKESKTDADPMVPNIGMEIKKIKVDVKLKKGQIIQPVIKDKPKQPKTKRNYGVFDSDIYKKHYNTSRSRRTPEPLVTEMAPDLAVNDDEDINDGGTNVHHLSEAVLPAVSGGSGEGSASSDHVHSKEFTVRSNERCWRRCNIDISFHRIWIGLNVTFSCKLRLSYRASKL